jgi:hypothetical protein
MSLQFPRPFGLQRRALLGSALALSAAGPLRAQPRSYRVIDLMPEYWDFHTQAEQLDTSSAAKLFVDMVARRHPEVYATHVLMLRPGATYEEEIARRYLLTATRLEGKIALMKRLSASIARDLTRYEARFREVFPDLDYRGDIYFMNSLGGFDGGVRQVKGRTTLLFGLDMIAFVYGEEADPQPFFHHELFHMYHSQFGGLGQDPRKTRVIERLWAEGLATWVAHALNPGAPPIAIFGLPRETPAQAQALMAELAPRLLADLDSGSPADYARWFIGTREANPSQPARSGYYLGYLVARRLAASRTLPELARTPLAELRPAIEAALRELAPGR